MKVMLIDVKKAHYNGVVPEDEVAYIELPGEAGQRGQCGRLNRWLYGMRHAAGAWDKEYSLKFVKMNFVKGVAHPTVFYRGDDQARCVVHGEDFTSEGEFEVLKIVAEQMREHYDLKVRAILGDEYGDDEEVTMLNRRIKLAHEGSSTRRTRGMWMIS